MHVTGRYFYMLINKKASIPYDTIFSNDFIAVCPLAVVMLENVL